MSVTEQLVSINDQLLKLNQQKMTLLAGQVEDELARLCTAIDQTIASKQQLYQDYTAACQRLEEDYNMANDKMARVRKGLTDQYLKVWCQLHPVVYQLTVNWNNMNHDVREIGTYSSRELAIAASKQPLDEAWYYHIEELNTANFSYNKARMVDSEAQYPAKTDGYN